MIDWIYWAQSHVDVIFYMHVLLCNMTSICLLSLTFKKNRSENVAPGEGPVKKNLT